MDFLPKNAVKKPKRITKSQSNGMPFRASESYYSTSATATAKSPSSGIKHDGSLGSGTKIRSNAVRSYENKGNWLKLKKFLNVSSNYNYSN